MNEHVEQRLLAFERNIVLRASAGTGKTEALTQLYLHLIGGGNGAAVAPARIVALTFTELAATEMRQRIRQAWSWLSTDADEGALDAEQAPRSAVALRQLWQQRGTTPSPTQLHAVQRQLEQARIGTIHGFCAALLRHAALDHGIDPQSTVLPPASADRLLEEAATAAVLQGLEEGDSQVRALYSDCRGLLGADALVPQLIHLHRQWVETGASSGLSAQAWNEQAADQAWREALKALDLPVGLPIVAALPPETLTTMWRSVLQAHLALATHERAKRSRSFREAAAVAQTLQQGPAPRRASALLASIVALQTACGSGGASEEPSARARREAVRTLLMLPSLRARSEAVARLLLQAERLYLAAKRQQGGLDYADLVRGARDLLRDQPALRRRLTGELEALLVDEFQDTNAAQRDLLYLLHARPAWQTGIPSPAALKPQGLFLVGDRKQSIYAFRGADVAVFEQTVADLLQQGAEELALQDNYRSTAPLLAGISQLTERTFGEDVHYEFELRFSAERDAVRAVRSAPENEPESDSAALELLALPDDVLPVEREGVAMARRIRQLIDDTAPPPVHREGRWQRPRYGDIAILLPRLTHLEPLQRALHAAAVPHAVSHGRGLLQTLEAEDLLSLAQLLCGEDDGTCLPSVLHSPWVGLPHDDLLAIAELPDVPAWRAPLAAWSHFVTQTPSASALQPLRATLETLLRLQALLPSLGLPRTLQWALQQLGYAATNLQAVANLERLLAEMERDEAAGISDARTSLQRLQRRRQRHEALATAELPLDDADQVRILTVHQAKGLQFPIVFAADLGRRLHAEGRALHFDADEGLSVGVRDSERGWISPPWLQTERRQRRQQAERRRLFYVQISRARDRLVLVESAKADRQSVWCQILAPLLPSLQEQGLLQRFAAPDEAVPAVATLPPTVEISELPAPSPSHTSLPSAPLELSVSQLHEWSLCPRRFRARYELGLPEAEQATARRGSLLHAVLERLDWRRLQNDADEAWQQALAEATRAAAHGCSADEGDELRRRAQAFLAGPYARQLASLPDGTVQREMPFALHVEVEPRLLLHGTLDLLSLEAEQIDLVDYKTATPAPADPLAPYRLQLQTYALALRRSFPAVPLRIGVQFLDGRSDAPNFEPFDTEAADAATQRLQTLAEELRQCQRDGHYAGRPLNTCRSLRCQLVDACHVHLTTNTASAPASNAPATR